MARNTYLLSESPLLLILSAFWLGGIDSCRSPVLEVCTERLPQFNVQMETAVLALGPWYKAEARTLASSSGVDDGRMAASMAGQDRRIWTNWAEAKLSEIQGQLDSLEQETQYQSVVKDFSAVANHLVTFHGYAQLGDAERMVASLKQIKTASSAIREKLCARTGPVATKQF